MRVLRPEWTTLRAVIAVAALYAFALQSVLGGVLGAGAFEGTRSIDPAHILCLQAQGPAENGPAEAPPAHGHHVCCTAAHAPPMVEAPILAAAAIVWPFRKAVRTVWRTEVVAAPRAPPGISAGARAPPVV